MRNRVKYLIGKILFILNKIVHEKNRILFYVDNMLIDRIKNKDLRLFMIIYVFITFGLSSIYYSDPYLIAQKSIPLLTFAILYAACGTIDKKKRIKKKVE